MPSLDNPVQEVMTAAPMLLPLGLMAIFAWIIARGWRNYRNTGDEFDLWDVVKFSFALVMLIATIALSLYGI